MRAALEKNAKSFEWMAVSREGHGMYEEDTRREVYDRILAFLDRNIGASARP
jgi:dipeptidyl aminopeptidase/acylaminoacyl peptidase